MREAVVQANELQRQFTDGVSPNGISWQAFCKRFRTEYVSTLKPRSRGDWPTVEIQLTAILDPVSIRAVNASAISQFAAELRRNGKSPATVAKYLRILRVALRWAERIRLIDKAPFIAIQKKPRKQAGMRGRPITLEEFERMIEVVPTVLAKTFELLPEDVSREAVTESWRHMLWGYWYSGLRLTEGVNLFWDRRDMLYIQGIDRKYPTLVIHSELEKGNEDRTYPLTPDFVDFLRQTPAEQRVGRVFRPMLVKGITRSPVTIGRIISAIGKAANVVVNSDTKYASAHDLRRSFGSRWAPFVTAPVLQQYMRHKAIQTTMDYYVELRAVETAETLWKAYERHQAGDPLWDPSQVSSLDESV